MRLLRDVQLSVNKVLISYHYHRSFQHFVNMSRNGSSSQERKLKQKKLLNAKKFENFDYFSSHFIAVWRYFIKCVFLPIVLLNMMLRARKEVKDFVSLEFKEVTYVDKWLRFYDESCCKSPHERAKLLPLKNFEKKVLTDKRRVALSRREKKEVFKQMGVYCMYSSLTLVFIAINFLLFFAMSLKATPPLLSIPSEPLQHDINFISTLSQVSFKVAELLEDLWRLLQSETVNTKNHSRFERSMTFVDCPLHLHPPTYSYLIFVSLVFSFSLLTTTTAPYACRFEETIKAFFYSQAKFRRTKELHKRLLKQRTRKESQNKENATKNLNFYIKNQLKSMSPKASKVSLMQEAVKCIERNFCFKYCFVCEETWCCLRACPSDSCQLRICADCLEDTGLMCPLCSLNDTRPKKTTNVSNGVFTERCQLGASVRKKHYMAYSKKHKKATHNFSKCVSSYYGSVGKEDFL